MITHVVLFKLKEPTRANLEKTCQALREMKGKIPQLLEITAGIDQLRSDRSYDIALITRFASMDDLKIYQDHPVHQKVIAYMATVRESAISVDFLS
jgi:hypothetical protein